MNRLLVLVLGLACSSREPPRPRPRGRADARAAAVADQVLERLGGADALSKVSRITFDFAVVTKGAKTHSVHHAWDVAHRSDEVTWRSRDGKALRAKVDLRTKEGDAWKNRAKLAGAERREALDDAFARWTNDTYWLLAPYKIRDPGVVLTHEGEEAVDGKPVDVLRLRFENVGLTPGDTYRMYVDRASHLVVRWDFVLEGESGEPKAWNWTEWRAHGPIWLAGDRVRDGGETIIRMEGLSVVPRS